MMVYEIKEIKYSDTKDFILKKHYAQRMPSVSFAYGLFDSSDMVGVLTIGKPASNSLCNGVCGPENAHKVYELNRLITEDNLSKNALSYFVGVITNSKKKTSKRARINPGPVYQSLTALVSPSTFTSSRRGARRSRNRLHNGVYDHLRRARIHNSKLQSFIIIILVHSERNKPSRIIRKTFTNISWHGRKSFIRSSNDIHSRMKIKNFLLS